MKNFFLKIWALITGTSAALWKFMEPILSNETGKLLDKILPIALGIVTEIAQTQDLPNAKRNAAYNQLKAAVVAAGIDASTSLLNSAVELAYQHLKASSEAKS